MAASNDDIERLFVWREGAHPLIVMVGRSTDVIFGQWRKEALQIGGAMAALGLIACALMLILAREMGKRGEMEDRMARSRHDRRPHRHSPTDVISTWCWIKEWQRAQRAAHRSRR